MPVVWEMKIKLIQYIPPNIPFLSVSKVNWMTDFQVFQRAFTVNCFGEYGKKKPKKTFFLLKKPPAFNSYLFIFLLV